MTDERRDVDALARLVASVAHDLNSTLTAIRGYAQLARADLPDGSPARDEIDQILMAAERATDLTRQLAVAAREALDPPV